MLVTEAGLPQLGAAWAAAEASGLRVTGAKLVGLSPEDATAAAAHVSGGGAGALAGGGPVIALALQGEGVGAKAAALAAHCGGGAGGVLAPGEGSDADAALSSAFFGPLPGLVSARLPLSAASPASALLVVLPHVLAGCGAGALLQDLTAALEGPGGRGLAVSGVRVLDLTRVQAEDFLEVYKGVVPEYVVRWRGGEGGGAAGGTGGWCWGGGCIVRGRGEGAPLTHS